MHTRPQEQGWTGLVLALLIAVSGSAPAAAADLQINTYTTGDQRRAAVATDGSGNFVVVWDSFSQDGSDAGIFGQRYDNAGALVGSEFQVNTYTTGRQVFPAVASDASGNFVVVWESDGQDGSARGVFCQRFNSTGTMVGGEFQVNTYTTGAQTDAAAAADSSGNFVVVWNSAGQDGSSYGVFGQRYDSSGTPVGSEFQVNAYTTDLQMFPAVTADPAGDFVVVWISRLQDDGVAHGIFGQRYDSTGAAVGSEFQVNTFTTGSQTNPSVSADGNGNFVVVWDSDTGDGDQETVFGQRYDSTGTAVGGEFQVNTYTTSFQAYPTVGMDADGAFLVTWMSSGQDGSDEGVYGQRYDSTGTAIGNEFRVNSYTTGGQYRSAVAADTTGFLVVWESDGQDGSGGGIFGHRTLGPIPTPALSPWGWALLATLLTLAGWVRLRRRFREV
jgi:hypothetical protein